MKRGGSRLRSARRVRRLARAGLLLRRRSLRGRFWRAWRMRSIRTWRLRGFARRAGGHGAIRADAARVHDVPEFAKRSGGFTQSFAIEFSGGKYRMSQAHRRANGFHNFPVIGGANARDHQAKRVGTGVNRREVYGFAKSQRHKGPARRMAGSACVECRDGRQFVSADPLLTETTLASPSIARKPWRSESDSNSFLIFA